MFYYCLATIGFLLFFFFESYGDHRDLHVLTHSFPTRRSSDLHANFSDTEIGDVVLMCGTWLGVGHGLKALGIGSVFAVPASEVTLRRLRKDRKSTRLNSSH